MLYWILAKSVDVEAETKVAKTEAEEPGAASTCSPAS